MSVGEFDQLPLFRDLTPDQLDLPQGIVLEGVIFSTGQTIVHWLTPAPKGSLNIFDNFQHFRNIHIRTHDGAQAVVTFGDGEQLKF